MARKPEVMRQEQLADGTAIETFTDGSTRHIDRDGRVISGITVTDKQIELWKKQPKEQALKEALELFKSQGMDISEAKFKLEVLKFITELQGALIPTIQTQNIVSIKISVADLPPGMKIIDVPAIIKGQ